MADPPGPTDVKLGLLVSLSTIRQLIPAIDLNDWSMLNSANRLYARLKSPGITFQSSTGYACAVKTAVW